MALKHGGNLIEIAGKYGSDPRDWVDLSTGVSPFPYPVTEIPLSVWNRLPETSDGLETAAMEYYGSDTIPLAVAGSQAAIMALPEVAFSNLGRCGKVLLPRVGYKEHQHAWAGFDNCGQKWQLGFYDDFPSDEQIRESDVVLLINPNNPAGHFCGQKMIEEACRILTETGGLLIVDEAFADCTPEISSLSGASEEKNLIVLRSVGKFFGLAGARVGFVFAPQDIRERMAEILGPWTVSGPARWVLKKALTDTEWQRGNRSKIRWTSARLNDLLDSTLNSTRAGTDLFTTVYLNDAGACHDILCRQQVLTRLCDEKDALRFGLPANDREWQRLEMALEVLCQSRQQPTQVK